MTDWIGFGTSVVNSRRERVQGRPAIESEPVQIAKMNNVANVSLGVVELDVKCPSSYEPAARHDLFAADRAQWDREALRTPELSFPDVRVITGEVTDVHRPFVRNVKATDEAADLAGRFLCWH